MPTLNFQMPEKIGIHQIAPNHTRFTLEPLETGYGHTIGNSIRRVVISSTEGYAVTNIKLPDSALHEFATIPGVIQSVTEMILNFKKVRFKGLKDTKEEKLTIVVKNKKVFTARDLAKVTSAFEILNPDWVICEMDKSANFTLELTVKKGRGYMSAKENKPDTPMIGYVAIDASFSPIEIIKYSVEDTLLGEKTDYDKLVVEIKTDGSIDPKTVISNAASTLIAHFALFSTKHMPKIQNEKENRLNQLTTQEELRIQKLLQTPIESLNFPLRLTSCLKQIKATTLADVIKMEISELLQFRNFGKKSLTTLQKFLDENRLHFGMDISRYENL